MKALTDLVVPRSRIDASQRLDGPAWWRGAVGYEIYIRSFLDTNGDGVGDLAGITERLDYLAALGIDVIWITPFFPSPGFDHGYDVSDYCDVDPMFGTLADFDHLVAEAHARGLRIFVDIVPNHTSSAHRWFQAAVADPAGPYRDYYVWAEPAADGGPPNNWLSHFGGPAWSLDPSGSGQYYCHLFLPEQPDLNWNNPAVMDEFAAILRFWSERGADGFRIDVAHGLTKDPELRDNPQLRDFEPGVHPTHAFESFDHIHDLHRIETVDIFRQWRAVANEYGGVLLGEMDTRRTERFADFVAGPDALHVGFVLKLGLTDWNGTDLIDDILEYQRVGNGGTAWEVSNHDQARATSRYGGGERGVRRTLALTTLMTALDGIPFIYQGEELALPNAVVLGDLEDPISTRNEGSTGRDVARGPVPWTSGTVNGFTSAASAWLHTEVLPPELTVQRQMDDPSSAWHRYRDLITLRKRFPELWQEPFTVDRRDAGLLVLKRGSLTVVANLDDQPATVDLATGATTIVFESVPQAANLSGDRLVVQPEACVIVDTHDGASSA